MFCSIFILINKRKIMGYSGKNQNGVLRTWNFQGHWSKHVEIPSINEKKQNFQGCSRKNREISMGPGFWTWNFLVVSHNFAEFLGVKACFLRTFLRYKVTNLKILGGFSEKYIYPQLPSSLFGIFLEQPKSKSFRNLKLCFEFLFVCLLQYYWC